MLAGFNERIIINRSITRPEKYFIPGLVALYYPLPGNSLNNMNRKYLEYDLRLALVELVLCPKWLENSLP